MTILGTKSAQISIPIKAFMVVLDRQDITINILISVVVSVVMDLKDQTVNSQRSAISDLIMVLVCMEENQLELMEIVNASALKDGMETAVKFLILVPHQVNSCAKMEEHLSEFAENASANAPEDGQANSVIRRLSVLLDQTT
ncbi:MAG: hypothetical protein QF535_21240 [Anaerolineales bacterium]|nr:hypothetical protein [Anaerolineales bacterium]